MKKILIAVTLMMALISTACQLNSLVQNVKPEDSRVNPEIIKASTMLIVVENIQKTGVILSYEMATLIKVQDETFLVTHNHWGEMLNDKNILELRDTENKMIRPMFASEFKDLVVYQDAGTMVLRAPDGVPEALIPASLYSNTWTVVTKYAVIDAAGNIDPDSETLTDKSRAAIFPEAFKKHILSLR
jgi:hypothetical protein